MLKSIAMILILTLSLTTMATGIFSQQVEAGLWDDHKGSVFTALKGLIMVWIINLIRQNTGEDDQSDNSIISTIKKGLNLGRQESTSTVEIITKSEQQESTDRKTGLNEQEQQMLELINERRREEGLQPLTIHQGLVEVARIKARDMIEHDYFAHDSPTFGSSFDLIKNRGITYELAGENLASAPGVERAFEELLKSPGHRKNILEARFNRVGLGVIPGGDHRLMVVQEFIEER